VQTRVLSPEHPQTLTSASNVAFSLSRQGKYADAERIQHEVHEVEKRVLGAEHPDTLTSAGNLATSLSYQRKHADAERIQREVHEAQKRVLGAEHPNTLSSAGNLAMSLADQGKYVEAEEMLHAAFASLQRVRGPAHPNTLGAARSLEHVRALIRATPPTNAAAPAAAGPERPLPAGARVLVQRLVAKPEHNGKRARVLSFDARTGRYAVALDDGKELSLKVDAWRRPGARGRDARRMMRAACALDARRCGTARASASAQAGRRTSEFARLHSHERWRVKAAMSLEQARSWQVKVYHSAVARGHSHRSWLDTGRSCQVRSGLLLGLSLGP
jgi:hypothetical protein